MPIRQSELRKERAREHTRREILLAAADVFARRGYSAATLAELAEAAGFAPPSLYRYFESKEEIFRSLVELVVQAFGATFEEPVDPKLPLAGRLEGLFRAQGRVAESIRPALEVLRGGSPELAAISPHLRSPSADMEFYQERLLDWLRRNTSPDEFRHPLELVARTFTGVAFAFRRCGEQLQPVDADFARLVVDLALHGIAAPAARRRGATS